ncbi:hypothetical protein D0T87_07270 [Bacteroides sp. 51]|nr:hypothetical protein [Bacteroides sp. 51]
MVIKFKLLCWLIKSSIYGVYYKFNTSKKYFVPKRQPVNTTRYVKQTSQAQQSEKAKRKQKEGI